MGRAVPQPGAWRKRCLDLLTAPCQAVGPACSLESHRPERIAWHWAVTTWRCQHLETRGPLPGWGWGASPGAMESPAVLGLTLESLACGGNWRAVQAARGCPGPEPRRVHPGLWLPIGGRCAPLAWAEAVSVGCNLSIWSHALGKYWRESLVINQKRIKPKLSCARCVCREESDKADSDVTDGPRLRGESRRPGAMAWVCFT